MVSYDGQDNNHIATADAATAGFDHCIRTTKDEIENTDLEALALVLIECMDSQPQGRIETIEERLKSVRRQRSVHKVFGIEDGERWSSSKQLIDFLDYLLCVEKPALSKLEKKVRRTSPMTYNYLTLISTLLYWTVTLTRKV